MGSPLTHHPTAPIHIHAVLYSTSDLSLEPVIQPQPSVSSLAAHTSDSLIVVHPKGHNVTVPRDLYKPHSTEGGRVAGPGETRKYSCAALAGGDWVDDAQVLRTGRITGPIGCAVNAPSNTGPFLCSFR